MHKDVLEFLADYETIQCKTPQVKEATWKDNY